MRAPGFWWRAEPGLLAWLLSPLGWLYGTVTLFRMRRQGSDAGVPVICVGNFVAGGAGKTPTAMALAALFAARGQTPFVLMRGYGGRLAGPVVVDPLSHDASDVGDEAMLMASRVPTIVARDRPAGAALAREKGANIIIMDDGLQNHSLAKRLRLAVVDGASGVGNGLCLPAGPLRAPLAGQFGATDAVIVIGAGEPGDRVTRRAEAAGLPVLQARLDSVPEVAETLRGRAVMALSGIGRPEKFTATLREAGATIAATRSFGDHHAYTAADVTGILAEATARDCPVATTEKDMVKLGPLWPAHERHRLVVVPVTLAFAAPDAISALLSGAAGPAQP